MHRSGTSCLTGILQNFGVELGEVFTENPHNKRGNRENSRIVFLNEALLSYNDAAWNKPAVISKWTPEMVAERDAIIRELTSRPMPYWGFKDTRTLFTLPFWLEGLNQPRFIGTFRHPHRVALSLNKRDGAPFEQSWELWRLYNERLLAVLHSYNAPLVDFDAPADGYLDDTLAKLIGLGLDETNAAKAREFFDAGLRNQSAAPIDDVELPETVAKLYARLCDYNKNNNSQ
jgi:hypothetical protein